MKPLLATLILGVSISACSSELPGPTTPTTQFSRIIELTGNLAFGSLQVGRTLTSALRIHNNGTGSMTVSALTLPSGYAANWTNGAIEAGRFQDVAITFSAANVQPYNGTVAVIADETSGTSTIGVAGAGVPVGGNVPSLLSPPDGAVLPNSTSGNRPIWTFTWTPVPGTTSYRLYVWRSGATLPNVDVPGITATSYDYHTIGDIISSNLQGWQWVVQSDQGLSEPRAFSVAATPTGPGLVSSPRLP